MPEADGAGGRWEALPGGGRRWLPPRLPHLLQPGERPDPDVNPYYTEEHELEAAATPVELPGGGSGAWPAAAAAAAREEGEEGEGGGGPEGGSYGGARGAGPPQGNGVDGGEGEGDGRGGGGGGGRGAKRAWGGGGGGAAAAAAAAEAKAAKKRGPKVVYAEDFEDL